MTDQLRREAPHRAIPPLFSDPGNRWYAWGKLRSDPIYERVAAQLGNAALPVLDVGCGIGITAFYLRLQGWQMPITGIDADQRKVDAAHAALARWPESSPFIRFEKGDARSLPDIEGTVLLLDVVHYVSPDQQKLIFTAAAHRVATGGRLILRDAIADGSWRARATMLQERFSRSIGWLRGERLEFPRRELLDAWAQECGLRLVHHEAMTRGNPFNNHLLVWERDR